MAAEQSETTLRRGMSLLFVLGCEESLRGGGLGVVRIAELAGMEKSQVSRTLRTLEACGLLNRDLDTLQYRLSWQLFSLAARAGDHQLVEAAPRILEQVVNQLQEAAYVSVLHGNEVLTIAAKNGVRIVQATVMVGQVSPAYCSSAGRVLLMDHSPEQIQTLFHDVELVRHAPRSPRSVEDMIKRIKKARLDGVAVVDEEYEAALTGVAAPIRDARGRIIAALNVSGPKFRLGADINVACKAVVAAAAELSSVLGAPEATRNDGGR